MHIANYLHLFLPLQYQKLNCTQNLFWGQDWFGFCLPDLSGRITSCHLSTQRSDCKHSNATTLTARITSCGLQTQQYSLELVFTIERLCRNCSRIYSKCRTRLSLLLLLVLHLLLSLHSSLISPLHPETERKLTGADPPAHQFPQHAGGRSAGLLRLRVLLTSSPPAQEEGGEVEWGGGVGLISLPPSLPCQAACASKWCAAFVLWFTWHSLCQHQDGGRGRGGDGGEEETNGGRKEGPLRGQTPALVREAGVVGGAADAWWLERHDDSGEGEEGGGRKEEEERHLSGGSSSCRPPPNSIRQQQQQLERFFFYRSKVTAATHVTENITNRRLCV